MVSGGAFLVPLPTKYKIFFFLYILCFCFFFSLRGLKKNKTNRTWQKAMYWNMNWNKDIRVSVVTSVCTVCVPSGASPALLACVAPAAVLCTGLHSWGEPWGRAAAWCTSPYPLFFFFFTLFPLAGPLSLTVHAITQWHSFIYYCTSAPPSPVSTNGTYVQWCFNTCIKAYKINLYCVFTSIFSVCALEASKFPHHTCVCRWILDLDWL